MHTLPETNIAPENRPSLKETSLPTIHFQVRAVSFREGISVYICSHILANLPKISLETLCGSLFVGYSVTCLSFHLDVFNHQLWNPKALICIKLRVKEIYPIFWFYVYIPGE